VGLAAFALFLLAPIVEIIRSAEHPTRRPALVLMTTLVSGFFVMGLTNAMFGILTVTTAYAAVCVVAGLLATPRSRRN
jgi:O-antigen ligase